MITVKFPRKGFIVEEVTEGCKTEGCPAKKLIVIPFEDYGEENFNELTEGMTRGQNAFDDYNEGACPICKKAVTFNRHFIVTSDVSTIKTAEEAVEYAVKVLKAPFPEGEAAIAKDAYSSYSYADCILKSPFPLGEPAIATNAQYSYEYSQDVLHAPFPLGEAAIATNAHIFKMYKILFPEPQVAPTEGDSKMKDIQEVYRKRVFDELTPVQLDEILLGEIDELHSPIKIGSLEFKASEIIKQLRPDALENNDFLVALFESEEWYESMMHRLDGGYCWLYPPTDENGEYLKYEGVDPKNDWSFFRWQGCHRIMRESKIYFLQEYKNILLQENKNDLLQEVKKELQHCLKHDNPIEVEIYSRTTSVRRFLNSNGKESFRAVAAPEPSVIPEPQAPPEPIKPIEVRTGVILQEVTEGCSCEKYAVHEGCNAEKFVVNSWEHYGEDTFNDLTEGCKRGEHSASYGDIEGACPKCRKPVIYKNYFVVTSDVSTIKTAEEAVEYAVKVLKAPFPEGEAAIAKDAIHSYRYARDVLKAPFPLGEAVIATDAIHSYRYARDVLKAPFPLGEAAIAKDAKYSYFYAKVVLKAPFPLGEAVIATDAIHSYRYAKVVLKAPFPLGEAAIATNAHIFKMYKKLFPEPQETPEPIKISNPISNLISEEVITETFAALKAANIEEVTVSFSDDSDGSPPVDWIKFCFNKQGIEDLIKNKKSRKGTLIRENLDLDDPNWHLEVYEYHFEEANIPNLKCTKELWNILVSFVYKEYETLDEKSEGYVVWKRNLVLLDSHRKLRDCDPSDGQDIPLFASGKYVRQYDKPNYTTMKTDELDGAALDFMVSYDEYLENVIPLRDDNDEIWSPSTIWEQGGVYIHLNNISICYENENQWKSYISVENTSYGSTPLVSSMRCFVKSKFGVTVNIPNWVLGKELAKA